MLFIGSDSNHVVINRIPKFNEPIQNENIYCFRIHVNYCIISVEEIYLRSHKISILAHFTCIKLYMVMRHVIAPILFEIFF